MKKLRLYSIKQMLLLVVVFLLVFIQPVITMIWDGFKWKYIVVGLCAGTFSLSFILVFLYFEGYRFINEKI